MVRGHVQGAVLCAVLAGCGTSPRAADEEQQAIIGGSADADDPAVFLLKAQPKQGPGWLCSSTLVAPDVVLTAAHCVNAVGTYRVFTGSDLSQVTAADVRSVREVHAHPKYDDAHIENGYDVGVALLSDAVTSIAPLAMNRTAMTSALIGSDVRLVGFGVSDAKTGSGVGLRRDVMVKLDAFTAMVLAVGDRTHGTCSGDSGGPALMTIDGQEVIVGVTSFGNEACDSDSFEDRVDALVSFVDGYVDGDAGTAQSVPAPADSSGCTIAHGGSSRLGPLLLVLVLRLRRRSTR